MFAHIVKAVIAKETKKYKGVHLEDVDTTEISSIKNAKAGVLTSKIPN